MKLQVLIVLAVLLVATTARRVGVTTNDNQDAESKPQLNHLGLWMRAEKPARNEQLTLVLALHHRNKQQLFDLWDKVSDPDSPSFRQFLSQEQLAELIAPETETATKVEKWITATTQALEHPHNETAIDKSQFNEFVTVTCTVEAAETLLGVSVYWWSHTSDPMRSFLRTADEISLPSDISEVIQVVSGLHDFSYPLTRRRGAREGSVLEPQPFSLSDGEKPAPYITFANNGNQQLQVTFQPRCAAEGAHGPICNQTEYKKEISYYTIKLSFANGQELTSRVVAEDATCSVISDQQGDWVDSCDVSVSNVPNWIMFNVSASTTFTDGLSSDFYQAPATLVCGPWAFPHVISKLYNVTGKSTTTTATTSEQDSGVVLFEFEFYSPKDLVSFMKANNLKSDEARVVAPTNPNVPDDPGQEAQADIELISANGVGSAESTFWYSSNGGDGVVQWALQVANMSDAELPKVWSLSWGIAESLFEKYVGKGAQDRINEELAKMGVRGMTVVVASGDAGVRPVGRSEFECGVFEPSFPASSLYVVTVSATMLTQNPSDQQQGQGQSHVTDIPACSLPMAGSNDPHISCSEDGLETAREVAVSCCSDGAVWTTGGGFSANYSLPSWQSDFVSRYLDSQGSKLPPDSFWNRRGRGFPDMSVVGDKVPTLRNGKLENFGGTSASAPITAGLFSLLNQALAAAGKQPIGPVTPLLYKLAAKNPRVFNDVTVGHNNCGELMCCRYGFECAESWDPVSGLGTPNYGLLEEAILAM